MSGKREEENQERLVLMCSRKSLRKGEWSIESNAMERSNEMSTENVSLGLATKRPLVFMFIFENSKIILQIICRSTHM